MKMKKMTSGKINFFPSFSKVYKKQVEFQQLITKIKCPSDNVEHFSYHIQAMVEELGEVMKADKRWKTHRNTTYNPEEKLDELADVFITAINMSIHSGFLPEEMIAAINKKIDVNFERLVQTKW